MKKKGKVVVSIEARMTSSRLPGKVMLEVLGKPILELMIERIKRAKLVDQIVIATTINSSDDPIALLAKKLGVGCHRGSEEDVLMRVLEAHRKYQSDIIVELTGDCNLIDPEMIDEIVQFYIDNDYDYVSNVLQREFPRGLDIQVFAASILEDVAKRTKDKDDHEHVSLFIYHHPELYSLQSWNNKSHPCYGRADLRWTVDTLQDFELMKKIYESLYPKNPKFRSEDIMKLIRKNPELASINVEIKQKPIRGKII